MRATLGEPTDARASARPVRTTCPQVGPQAVDHARILWTDDPSAGEGRRPSVDGTWRSRSAGRTPCVRPVRPRRTSPTQPGNGRRGSSGTRVHPAGTLRRTGCRDWVTQTRGPSETSRRPEVVTRSGHRRALATHTRKGPSPISGPFRDWWFRDRTSSFLNHRRLRIPLNCGDLSVFCGELGSLLWMNRPIPVEPEEC